MIRKKRQAVLNNPRVVLGACAALVGVGVLALGLHEVGAWLASRPVSPLVDYPGPQLGAGRQPGTPQPRAQAAAQVPYATPPAGGNSVAEPPVKPVTLIPMLGEEHPDDAALVTHYMKQIVGDNVPTWRDWQVLQASLPADKRGLVKAPLGAGHFVMSMCLDLQGNLWAATEGEGVFRYFPGKPAAEQWRQFTKADGLLDDCFYAAACDKQGRVWLGSLNHGVTVWNGEKFQVYEVVGGLSRPDTLNGPLGEHVVHITVAPEFADAASAPSFHDPLTEKDSPISGSVWMCTSAGLSIYFLSTDTWSYLTRADGLPSDQANSLAFDKDGTVFVASQCDGIAIASPKDGYKTWKQVARRNADVPSASSTQPSSLNTHASDLTDDLPTTPTGTGLPTNLMNDILVTKDGTVYTATTAGLAWSSDKGETWQYVRGADYADKVKGRLAGPPKDWKPQPGAILSEDYATALAEDAEGNIHIAHRAAVSEAVLPQATARASTSFADFTSCLLAIGGTEIRGGYSTGLSLGAKGSEKITFSASSSTPTAADLKFPSGAAASSLEELAKMTEIIKSQSQSPRAAEYLGEDWR